MTNSTLNRVEEWQRRACPTPDARAFDVALGCHIEEFTEMLQTVEFYTPQLVETGVDASRLLGELNRYASALKSGFAVAVIRDRREFLDALADQVVTGVGVGYRAGMDVPRACQRVDASNWTKFGDDGRPIFDANGKVTKGPGYLPPNLEGLY